MSQGGEPSAADVFVSYASQDRRAVVDLLGELEAHGISVWLDRERIAGGTCYGPQIVRGIRASKAMLVVCTVASMRSRNVSQEILLAWKYARPYVPLLFEPVGVPEQLEYWLEGWQWIEIAGTPRDVWMPRLLEALDRLGISGSEIGTQQPAVAHPMMRWRDLSRAARWTDRIWPVPASERPKAGHRATLRDLGAAQDGAQRRFRVGDAVTIAVEAEHDGHLLLINEGTTGRVYCLCPSLFAPQTRIARGTSYFPQIEASYDAFVISGAAGREHVLALLTEMPLMPEWMSADRAAPARVLDRPDLVTLLERLGELDTDRWVALSTYFDVLPRRRD